MAGCVLPAADLPTVTKIKWAVSDHGLMLEITMHGCRTVFFVVQIITSSINDLKVTMQRTQVRPGATQPKLQPTGIHGVSNLYQNLDKESREISRLQWHETHAEFAQTFTFHGMLRYSNNTLECNFLVKCANIRFSELPLLDLRSACVGVLLFSHQYCCQDR
eukprot:scaffold24926_cov21-Prasinocladus_malaysianus.AAC.1